MIEFLGCILNNCKALLECVLQPIANRGLPLKPFFIIRSYASVFICSPTTNLANPRMIQLLIRKIGSFKQLKFQIDTTLEMILNQDYQKAIMKIIARC